MPYKKDRLFPAALLRYTLHTIKFTQHIFTVKESPEGCRGSCTYHDSPLLEHSSSTSQSYLELAYSLCLRPHPQATTDLLPIFIRFPFV